MTACISGQRLLQVGAGRWRLPIDPVQCCSEYAQPRRASAVRYLPELRASDGGQCGRMATTRTGRSLWFLIVLSAADSDGGRRAWTHEPECAG
jgi:hypothetical protein